MKSLILILSLGFVHVSFAQSIDSEASKVTFEISNMGFNTVEGTFSGMSGIVQFDTEDLANSRFDVCIKAESVNTGNDTRDRHLRKENFFHVEQHPSICFQSSSISQNADGFLAKGTLSMRGVSKEVSIPFSYSNNTFTGTLSLERGDYDVGPKGGMMVGKTVELEIICVVK